MRLLEHVPEAESHLTRCIVNVAEEIKQLNKLAVGGKMDWM